MNIDRCKGCGYWNKTRRECWCVGRCIYKDDIADRSSVEKRKEVVSPLKTFSDSDGMAFLHIGKDIIPIKMFSVHVNHSADIYPEFTIEGRWMAGSSEKDPSITISKVIFNPPATIVFWKDGSKTVVKCQDGDVFDPEKGLAMAFMKKAYGNAGKYCDEVKKWVEPYEKEQCEKLLAKHDFARTNVLSAEELRKALERAKIEHPDILERSIKEETPLCQAMYDGAMEAMKANLDAKKDCEECGWSLKVAKPPLKEFACNHPFGEDGCPFEEKKGIEELFPGILSKAESLAKATIMTTEDAIRRLVNERLKDVEPSLREYYLGQLEPVLAKLKESEEKENKEMKRTLTRISTVEITEVIDLSKYPSAEDVTEESYKIALGESIKQYLHADDVNVLKVQDFVSENDRK